ncbi:hypothetical protein LTR66_018001, partial [Elasticomyces elasticus]
MTHREREAQLKSKLDPHLSDLLTHVDILSFYHPRITPEQTASRTLPQVQLVELVSAENFAEHYDALYESSFSIDAERESSNLIIERLKDEFAGRRSHLQPYRIVGLRDHDDEAIGAAQFSVLFLKNGQHAVPYLQYIYVDEKHRGQGHADLLHALTLAVAQADAERRGEHITVS